MSFLQREIERLRQALQDPNSNRYAELYAAQQALSWAIEPDGFKSPHKMITGIQKNSEDCPAPATKEGE